MQFEGAVIKEQGVTFAIVVVKPHVLNNSIDMENARRNFSVYFPQTPIVLMAQDSRGIPTYSGRRDIVSFLSKIPPSRIPWKKFTTN
jgi:hypothetical protein